MSNDELIREARRRVKAHAAFARSHRTSPSLDALYVDHDRMADALEAAEAKIERALAEADEWINSPSGSIASTRGAGRVFRRILSGGEP